MSNKTFFGFAKQSYVILTEEELNNQVSDPEAWREQD